MCVEQKYTSSWKECYKLIIFRYTWTERWLLIKHIAKLSSWEMQAFKHLDVFSSLCYVFDTSTDEVMMLHPLRFSLNTQVSRSHTGSVTFYKM
jgi:hypothetical protein